MRGVSLARDGAVEPIRSHRRRRCPHYSSYKEHPETGQQLVAHLVSAFEDVTEIASGLTLLAAVGAVLPSRAAMSRTCCWCVSRDASEIALRMALGAERRGIVRLFVLESTLVSVIAGVIGLCLALWTVSVVPKLAGQNIPLEGEVKLQLPVLVFTLGLSLLTGLLMGLYPAWQSSRADLVDGLKEGGRGTSGSRGQHRFRRGLVAGQVGLSVVLLAGAAMLVSSFIRLSRQEAGFRSERVWAGGIGLPPAKYPDPATRARFAERLQTELQTAPGAAAITDAVRSPEILRDRLTRVPTGTRSRSTSGNLG
jgi:hypothetical protein